MDWVLITAMIFAAWVAVSLIGYERQRRVDMISAQPPAPLPAGEPQTH